MQRLLREHVKDNLENGHIRRNNTSLPSSFWERPAVSYSSGTISNGWPVNNLEINSHKKQHSNSNGLLVRLPKIGGRNLTSFLSADIGSAGGPHGFGSKHHDL